jgi:hypothetical protein
MAEGRISLFAVFNDPNQLEMLVGPPGSDEDMPAGVVPFVLTFLALVAAAGVIARANVRKGRIDRRGTTWLAVVVFVTTFAWDLLEAHAVFNQLGIIQLFSILSTSVFYTTIAVAFYLAFEPYVRRVWPSMLVSWTRLLGRGPRGWRDPVVGRSILAGLAVACIMLLIGPVEYWLNSLIYNGGVPERPLVGNWTTLVSQWKTLGQVAAAINFGLVMSVLFVLTLVIGRLLLRRQWLAAVLAVIVSLIFSFGTAFPPPTVVTILLRAVVLTAYVFVLLRFGLVGLIICFFVENMNGLGFAVDWTAWHGRPAVLAALVLAVVAAFAVWAATAGRKFLKDEAFGG